MSWWGSLCCGWQATTICTHLCICIIVFVYLYWCIYVCIIIQRCTSWRGSCCGWQTTIRRLLLRSPVQWHHLHLHPHHHLHYHRHHYRHSHRILVSWPKLYMLQKPICRIQLVAINDKNPIAICEKMILFLGCPDLPLHPQRSDWHLSRQAHPPTEAKNGFGW